MGQPDAGAACASSQYALQCNGVVPPTGCTPAAGVGVYCCGTPACASDAVSICGGTTTSFECTPGLVPDPAECIAVVTHGRETSYCCVTTSACLPAPPTFGANDCSAGEAPWICPGSNRPPVPLKCGAMVTSDAGASPYYCCASEGDAG